MSPASAERDVRRRLERALAQARLLAWIGGAAAALGPALAVFAGTLGSLRVLDALGILSTGARRSLWGAGAAVAVGLIVRVARRVPWSAPATARRLARPGAPGDEFLTAWELCRREPGGGLAEILLASWPAPGLPEMTRNLWTPAWRRQWLVGIAGLSFLLALARLAPGTENSWWPFGADAVPGVLSLRPGDAFFPRGDTVSIEVQLAGPETSIPEPWVQGEGSPWARRVWSAVDGDRCVLSLENLRGKTRYRLEGGGHRSRAYTLTPTDPPRLKVFSAEVRPPAGSAGASERAANPFAPEALRGGAIVFSGEWEEDVAEFRVGDAGGTYRSVNPPGPRFQWSRVVDGPAVIGLWAARRGDPGAPVHVADVSVALRADAPPQIRWVEPAEDLRVSVGEEAPLSYEASDDRGIAAVFLEWALNDGPSQRALEKSFAPGAGAGGDPLRGEVVWPLSAIKLSPGDRFALRWRVRDGSSGVGVSEPRRFWVVDDAAEHAALLQSLAEWGDALTQRRAQQTRLVESLRGPGVDWSSAAERQAALGSSLRGDAARLGALADALDRDPLSGPMAGEARRALAEELSGVAETAIPSAAADLQRGQPGGAESVQAALDRLAALNDDARRQEDFQRWADDASELKRAAGALAETLAGRAGALTEAQRAELAKTLAGLERSLARLKKSIQEALPPESGENPQGGDRRFLRLDDVQKDFADLMAALALGDASAALSAARRAMEKLDAAESALRSAGGTGVDGAFSEAAEAWRQRVLALAERQEALMADSREVADRRTARRLAEQDQALAALPTRAAEWREAAGALEKEWRGGDIDRSLWEGLWIVRTQVAALERAGSSPAQAVPRLTETVESLRRVAGEWERANAAVPPPGPAAPGDEEKKYNDRKRWGETLRRMVDESSRTLAAFGALDRPASDLDPADRIRTLRQSTTEAALAGDTDAAAASLSAPGTPLAGAVGPARRAGEAAVSMRAAAEALGEIRLTDAVQRQENALSLLREAAESLARAGARASARAAGSRGRFRTAGRPGAVSSPAVRLPGKSPAEASEEFRRALRQSMKDRYPKNYEKIVQDYYRHWSK